MYTPEYLSQVEGRRPQQTRYRVYNRNENKRILREQVLTELLPAMQSLIGPAQQDRYFADAMDGGNLGVWNFSLIQSEYTFALRASLLCSPLQYRVTVTMDLGDPEVIPGQMAKVLVEDENDCHLPGIALLGHDGWELSWNVE